MYEHPGPARFRWVASAPLKRQSRDQTPIHHEQEVTALVRDAAVRLLLLGQLPAASPATALHWCLEGGNDAFDDVFLAEEQDGIRPIVVEAKGGYLDAKTRRSLECKLRRLLEKHEKRAKKAGKDVLSCLWTTVDVLLAASELRSSARPLELSGERCDWAQVLLHPKGDFRRARAETFTQLIRVLLAAHLSSTLLPPRVVFVTPSVTAREREKLTDTLRAVGSLQCLDSVWHIGLWWDPENRQVVGHPKRIWPPT